MVLAPCFSVSVFFHGRQGIYQLPVRVPERSLIPIIVPNGITRSPVETELISLVYDVFARSGQEESGVTRSKQALGKAIPVSLPVNKRKPTEVEVRRGYVAYPHVFPDGPQPPWVFSCRHLGHRHEVS